MYIKSATDQQNNKKSQITQHLSINFSVVVFLLLSHSSYLPLWVRIVCGFVVIACLIYLHFLFRRALN